MHGRRTLPVVGPDDVVVVLDHELGGGNALLGLHDLAARSGCEPT